MVELSRNSADKAEADLKTAISISPQSPQAYLELGKLRLSKKGFPRPSRCWNRHCNTILIPL